DLLISEQKDVHSQELQPGQILFMNNTKLLHSNTSYSPESDRLVYRIRQYVPALSAANTIAKLTEEQLPQNSKDTPDSLDKLSENVAFGAIDSSVVERVMSEESVDRAIKFCDAFLKENPNDPTALVLQARVYDSHNRQMDALRPLELARKAQPNNPDVLKAYGKQLIRVGEFVEAKEVLEKFHRLNPTDHSGNVDYSAVLNKLGERKQAREILEQLIGNHPIQKASIGSGGKATVLRLRGLQSASFEIVHNEQGYYEAELRSGHFATDELFKEQNYEMIVFNILNDNLNRVEKLPNCDIILNTVSCPDLERKSLMTIASFTDRFPDVPLVNCARLVLQTTRDRASQRMQGVEGVHYPQSERIIWRGGSPEDVCKNLSALGFRCPIILRPININSSAGVRRIDNQADIALYFANAKAGSAHYAIQYEDLRGPHGLYNRLRMFCIDGNFYPSSNLYSDNWMLDDDDRYTTMMSHSWTQLEEMNYLDDPIAHLGSEAYMRLRRIRDVVGLDFFGIDFHLLPDGELYVFRISASMRHSFDHVADFPYAEPHQQRISNAFDTMMRRRFKKGPETAEPQLPMVAAE
ncbi:MAG: hypothetical protein JKY99_02375, partial [Rhizobiales bacterium]|nr:hypothetical protein [Hyphomicrobiales bacterium]